MTPWWPCTLCDSPRGEHWACAFTFIFGPFAYRCCCEDRRRAALRVLAVDVEAALSPGVLSGEQAR